MAGKRKIPLKSGAPLAARLGSRRFALGCYGAQGVGWAAVAVAQTRPALVVAAVLTGLTVGNTLLLHPLLLSEYFGPASYPKIFATSQLVVTAGVAAGPFVLGWVHDHAGGYGTAYATAALQHPELAAEQVEHAVKKLGFRGVSVGGSVAGEELANPRFHPFWKKCEELDVLVFLHPTGTRELEASGRLAGSGLLSNTIGNPLETTIALSHLIFEGTLDRFPGLKICAAHGGGYLGSYANRSDAVIRTFPNRVGPLPKKKPTQYLKDGQLFFDTIVFTPEALRHLIAETGVGQIVIGTDYPAGGDIVGGAVRWIENCPFLDATEKDKVLFRNAERFLGLTA